MHHCVVAPVTIGALEARVELLKAEAIRRDLHRAEGENRADGESPRAAHRPLPAHRNGGPGLPPCPLGWGRT